MPLGAPHVRLDLLIAADDRTGAIEVAGMAADTGIGAVPVLTAGPLTRADAMDTSPATMPVTTSLTPSVNVVDLASRPCTPAEAARRSAGVDGWVDGADDDAHLPLAAHKIDSTLRGNWAHEVLARAGARGRRVLAVAAFPALGRTCVDGVVLVDGRPVGDGAAASDPRTPVRSSRPADLLHQAGAGAVELLGSAAHVARWLTDDTGTIGVCDASTDRDLASIAAAWAADPARCSTVLLAGTAAALAAGVGALVGPREPTPAPPVRAPALVVCGSLHPTARRQLAVLASARPDVTIVATDQPLGPITDADAHRAAAALATQAHDLLTARRFGTLVVLGGDTATAVLGDGVAWVGGTIAPGVPWLRSVDGSGPVVLTRSGGFGGDDALVDLLRAVRST